MKYQEIIKRSKVLLFGWSSTGSVLKHYQKCGFDLLGLLELKDTVGLPAHYHNATLSLFEMKASIEINAGQYCKVKVLIIERMAASYISSSIS